MGSTRRRSSQSGKAGIGPPMVAANVPDLPPGTIVAGPRDWIQLWVHRKMTGSRQSSLGDQCRSDNGLGVQPARGEVQETPSANQSQPKPIAVLKERRSISNFDPPTEKRCTIRSHAACLSRDTFLAASATADRLQGAIAELPACRCC